MAESFSCKTEHHLKCLGKNFETNNSCERCSILLTSSVDQEEEEEVQCILHPHLVDALKLYGLKIGHLNIRSLPRNIEQLRLIMACSKGLSILTLSETWLNEGILDEEILFPGYNLYRFDRGTGQKGGGVAVYISETITAMRCCELNSPRLESLWMEIFLPKSKGILLGTFYRPPNETTAFFYVFGDVLEMASAENKEIKICGDFNCSFKAPKLCINTKKLISILCSCSLTQLMESPT